MRMRAKSKNCNTTAFYDKDFARIDGELINTMSAIGTIKVCLESYPYIKLNIMYRCPPNHYKQTKEKILKVKNEILKLLEDRGFTIQKVKKQ